ncbi:hypothetical protein J3R74_001869 [Puniceicoccus vermicola]
MSFRSINCLRCCFVLGTFLLPFVGVATESEEFVLERSTLDFDRGELVLSKDRSGEPKEIPEDGPIPNQDAELEYDFEVPEDGWYVLSLKNMPPWAREIFVDDERVSLTVGNSFKRAAELAGIDVNEVTDAEWVKEANLVLSEGAHTLRIQRVGRMGFPGGFPSAWQIRSAGETSRDRFSGGYTSFREVRRGESVELTLYGGGGDRETSYDLIRVNLLDNRKEVIDTIRFPASGSVEKRVVEIPCPEEGVFQLFIDSDDGVLSAREFTEGVYYVIDTSSRTVPESGETTMTLVSEVDLVALTLNGEALELGENYWEGNGATRIVDSAIGTYRETNDGRGPDVDPNPSLFSENFSGFAVLLDIPEAGVPYVIEIDHPDDAWRSVCGSILDMFDWDKQKGYMPRAFGYETGGNLPLSNQMLTERVVFWPNGNQVHLGLTSSRIGKRAAASGIRLYRVEGPLVSQGQNGSGRLAGIWMEEHERWHEHFNTPQDLPMEVRDWIGLNRTMEWIAYRGMNAFWPTVVAYQQSTYDSKELKGYLLKLNNMPRLSALLAEKYGVSYVAEIFLARQRYFNERVMIEGVENPEELYTTVWWGYSRGTSDSQGGMWPNWNVLHPHVQEKMIAIYGELADMLADTESFTGLSGRLDTWQWDGLYALSSLNWGYGDWTIRQFEEDTNVEVPGNSDDPARFEQRFRFLTSDSMRQQWIDWRKDRVTRFIERLAERIREAKPDAVLFLCGDGYTDENHRASLPLSVSQRFIEMGIDLEKLQDHPGIGIMTTANFGRGKSRTYLADQLAYDSFLDPDYVNAGRNYVRGFAPYGAYQEWGKEFPFEELGVHFRKKLHYCAGSDAAGPHLLERYATVLAEQDTMFFRTGGYPILWGEQDRFSTWMREYAALPRVPFDPIKVARDPVAVWDQNYEGSYWFYAVNRERYPVTLTLEFGTEESVYQLGADREFATENGKLTLELEPFALRSFRTSSDARIQAAVTSVPERAINWIRRRLAFAQRVADQIQKGVFADSISADEQKVYRIELDAAWKAVEEQSWWRARTILTSAPMMAIYEQVGPYPEDQVKTQFPNLLESLLTDRYAPDEPFSDAEALVKSLIGEGGSEESESYNPEWKFAQVVKNLSDGLRFEIEIPAAGFYSLRLGHVAEESGVAQVSIGGRNLPVPVQMSSTGVPEKTIFPEIQLESGAAVLEVSGNFSFGVYALQLIPKLSPLDTTRWSTVAPFQSFWVPSGKTNENVKRTMEKPYPPERDPSIQATYRNQMGQELVWTQTEEIVGRHEKSGVNFAQRSGLTGYNVGFAQTFIYSPEECEVLLYLGCDWWANAWINGDLIETDSGKESYEETGAWFHRWKPRVARIHLNAGENRLMVKNQGGNAWCWFTSYITDPGDLEVSPVPFE